MGGGEGRGGEGRKFHDVELRTMYDTGNGLRLSCSFLFSHCVDKDK